MPRRRDPRREEAFTLWEDGMTPIAEIADALGVSASQVRNWKSQDGWEQAPRQNNANAKTQNVSAKRDKKVQSKRDITKRASRSVTINDSPGTTDFEKFVFRDLTDGERLLLGTDRDKYRMIQAQIDRYTVQEMRILRQIEGLETTPSGAKSQGKDVNMVADTVKVSKGTHVGQNENLIEVTSVAKEKRLMELWDRLARVQGLKTQALKVKHQMIVDDAKYGLAMNEGVEMAKDNARMVLEALTGEVKERVEYV